MLQQTNLNFLPRDNYEDHRLAMMRVDHLSLLLPIGAKYEVVGRSRVHVYRSGS
jgi:hypothetical protein